MKIQIKNPWHDTLNEYLGQYQGKLTDEGLGFKHLGDTTHANSPRCK